jgi:hypothetical protein
MMECAVTGQLARMGLESQDPDEWMAPVRMLSTAVGILLERLNLNRERTRFGGLLEALRPIVTGEG